MTASLGAAARRILDIGISATLLVMLSPVLALLSIAVKIDSPGPALFRQDRVGRGGDCFRIHKYRTMRAEAPGVLVTSSRDERITRVGRVLRRTKLDELPQLVDVLVGDMSLVGPRPEVPEYVALWPTDARDVILSVRPGITDPATVDLRHESDRLAETDDPEAYYVHVLLPEKVARYVDYLENRSFVGDLRILVRTARAVLS